MEPSRSRGLNGAERSVPLTRLTIILTVLLAALASSCSRAEGTEPAPPPPTPVVTPDALLVERTSPPGDPRAVVTCLDSSSSVSEPLFEVVLDRLQTAFAATLESPVEDLAPLDAVVLDVVPSLDIQVSVLADLRLDGVGTAPSTDDLRDWTEEQRASNEVLAAETMEFIDRNLQVMDAHAASVAAAEQELRGFVEELNGVTYRGGTTLLWTCIDRSARILRDFAGDRLLYLASDFDGTDTTLATTRLDGIDVFMVPICSSSPQGPADCVARMDELATELKSAGASSAEPLDIFYLDPSTWVKGS